MTKAQAHGNNEISPQLLEEITKAFNRHDVRALLDYFDENAVFRLARGSAAEGTTLRGKVEIEEFLSERFDNASDMHWEEIDHWTSGDRGVSEWFVSYTLPSGERARLRGCDLYRFRGSKIVVKDTYWKSREEVL